MVMMAISSRASGCWDSLGCPYGIFFERDPWKRTKIRAVLDRISTGSRTRVPGSRLNGGNPPLVSPMGLVWHQSPPYIPFSFSSTPHRGRSPEIPTAKLLRTPSPRRSKRCSRRAAGKSRMRQRQRVDDMEQSEVRIHTDGQRKHPRASEDSQTSSE